MAQLIDWPTIAQVAAQTGHSCAALRQWVQKRRLAAVKDERGTIRVDPSTLAFLPPAGQTSRRGHPWPTLGNAPSASLTDA